MQRNNLHKYMCVRKLTFVFLFLISILGLAGCVTAVQTVHPTYKENQSNCDEFGSLTREPDQKVETFYISKLGDNADGASWESAWNELSNVDWGKVYPGDRIVIDGGVESMVYETSLTIKRCGTREFPITIQLSEEAGRNGQAVLFGGRSTELPYCGQPDYVYQDDALGTGIKFGTTANIVLDGTKWSGIVIHGFNSTGLRLDSGAENITVRNLEIFDNGSARQRDDSLWYPDRPGILLTGTDIQFERMIVHDNGADSFQSLWNSEGIINFTLRDSWLYNSRIHPTVDESTNFCMHSDGIQIYSGGEQGPLLIEESVIGPGFTQGIILGQTPNENGASATVNDVTVRNVLFTKAADNAIMAYPDIEPSNWIIENVTAHCPKTKGNCILLQGPGHTIRNSVFHGSNLHMLEAESIYDENCTWQNSGARIGLNDDPKFLDASESDHFSLDNYKLSPDSPCSGLGSRITSVEQLLKK